MDKSKILAVLIVLFVVHAAVILLGGVGGTEEGVKYTLTFDDGYAGQYLAAAYLKERGIRGTFYVTGLEEFEGKKLLTPDEISEIAEFHEIGWHTRNHVNATEMDRSEASPLYEAKVFAYPHGIVGNLPLVEEFYRSARTTGWGFNEPLDCARLQAITITSRNFEWALEYADKAESGWVVFAVHDVTDDPRPDVDITWDQFYRLVDYLSSKGWRRVDAGSCTE